MVTLQCLIDHYQQEDGAWYGRAQVVLNECFPFSCYLPEYWSLNSLDASKCSVFVIELPQQLVVQQSYHVRNKAGYKKRRK